MSKWTKFAAVALVAAMAAACGDDEGTTEDLTQAEKTALANALATTEFGGLASFVVDVVGEVGTLDAATVNAALTTAFDQAMSLSSVGSQSPDYEGAVGIAIEFDYNIQGEIFQGWFYGVFGWNDINTSNNTVGEWVLVGGFGEEGTLPSSASGTIEDGDVFAYYALSGTPYYGIAGEASVSNTSFGSATDCSSSSQGITVDCEYAAGRMGGDFSFTAETLDAQTSYDQTGITFTNLPAVRMTLTVTD